MPKATLTERTFGEGTEDETLFERVSTWDVSDRRKAWRFCTALHDAYGERVEIAESEEWDRILILHSVKRK